MTQLTDNEFTNYAGQSGNDSCCHDPRNTTPFYQLGFFQVETKQWKEIKWTLGLVYK